MIIYNMPQVKPTAINIKDIIKNAAEKCCNAFGVSFFKKLNSDTTPTKRMGNPVSLNLSNTKESTLQTQVAKSNLFKGISSATSAMDKAEQLEKALNESFKLSPRANQRQILAKSI